MAQVWDGNWLGEDEARELLDELFSQRAVHAPEPQKLRKHRNLHPDSPIRNLRDTPSPGCVSWGMMAE